MFMMIISFGDMDIELKNECKLAVTYEGAGLGRLNDWRSLSHVTIEKSFIFTGVMTF